VWKRPANHDIFSICGPSVGGTGIYTSIMAEYSTLDNFIIRIYRVDTEDCRKITGLVEMMDGSGEREPFADLDELGALLNRHLSRPPKKQKKRSKTIEDSQEQAPENLRSLRKNY
jgi:hypothetical protein